LLRLRPAFVDCDVTFATVNEAYRSDVGNAPFFVIPDANRWAKLKLARTAFSVLKLLLHERPEVVISTGASPGYFALWLGKKLRARTIWVDSLANVEELSMSGQLVRRHADLWLTQWPHLAGATGPEFLGSVM